MPQATVQQLITGAMRWSGIVGAGENPTTSELNDALLRLNAIIGQLSATGIAIPSVTRTVIAATGSEQLTLSFRPIAVLGLRLSASGISVGYARVDPSTYATEPRDFVFTYDAAQSYPAIYVRPAATSGNYYLWSLAPLSEFSSLSEYVTLTPGYFHLLTTALGVDLATEYGRPVSEAMYREYQEALAAVRSSTVANIMPAAAQQQGGEK